MRTTVSGYEDVSGSNAATVGQSPDQSKPITKQLTFTWGVDCEASKILQHGLEAQSACGTEVSMALNRGLISHQDQLSIFQK